MLSSSEFDQWCIKLHLSSVVIELIKRVRESEPSRQVGGGSKNVVGAYPSRKMGKSIHFESHKVELPGLYLKEHDPHVMEMYDQPPSIKLLYKSAKEKVLSIYHTPDYFVLYDDKAGWEEWKAEEDLSQLSKESPNRYIMVNGKWRCPPGEAYANQFGLHYWVKSAGEINWQLQRNIIFLEDYLLDNKTVYSDTDVKHIISYVRNKPGVLLLELLRDNSENADKIYYLIAKKILHVDLDREILSEPELTHVFLDEESAIAHKTCITDRNITRLASHTLNIVPGTNILWDGNSWTIVNVGTKNISIVSVDGNICELPNEKFFNMASDQRIKGAENDIIKATDETINSKIAEASEQEIREANCRYKIILPILEGAGINDLESVEVTQRTIRNWLNSYKQAEQQYGSGFIGLIPNIKKRGNRVSHLPDDTVNAIYKFLDENETITNQRSKVLYGKFCALCENSGIIAPSDKTFYAIMKSRSLYQRTYKTQGSRAAYQYAQFYWELDMTTPKHGERPFEIAHIDHTEIDLELAHSKTGKGLGRAWLTIMIDAFSRKVLSFYITFDAPSYKSDMMALRECVRRFNRLPQIIVTDNGRDFKSTYFQSLLAFYGVTHKIRPPHKARYGSIGERIFGTTMTQLVHNLQGNTKIMKNVRQVTKSVNPKNHAVWSLPELYELLKEYFYEFYDTQEHSTLGESPREAFERGIIVSGKRPFRFIPYNQSFIIMTLPIGKKNNGTAKVDPQRGVKVNYLYYYCDEFYKSNMAGTRVQVRYDPWDIGNIYCLIKGHWARCYSQYYVIFKNKTENEIGLASSEIMKQKMNQSINSCVSAKELADFISSAEQTEEMLNQQFRDTEMAPQLTVLKGCYIYEENANDVSINKNSDYDINEKLDFSMDDD